MTIELVQERFDETDNRTWYEPVIATVAGKGNWNETWRFHGLPDFWTSPTLTLEVGKTYKIRCTVRKYIKQDNTPGFYHDIKQARLATEDEVPTQTPAASGNGPQSQPQRVRDDGSAVFRTKEELRWTEAYHMAARVAWSSEMEFTPGWQDYLSAWAGWFYNELAAVDAPAAEEPEEAYADPGNGTEPDMPPPLDEEPGDTLPF